MSADAPCQALNDVGESESLDTDTLNCDPHADHVEDGIKISYACGCPYQALDVG